MHTATINSTVLSLGDGRKKDFRYTLYVQCVFDSVPYQNVLRAAREAERRRSKIIVHIK